MAAIGLIDFDGCGDGDRTLSQWNSLSFVTVDPTFAAISGYGIRVLGIGGSLVRFFVAGGGSPAAGTHLTHPIVGWHWNPRTSAATNYVVAQLREGTTCHLALRIYGDGSVTVRRGNLLSGTLLGSLPAGTVAQLAWTYVEIDAIISDTIGEVRVHIGGVSTPDLNVTGIDTKNGATGFVDNIKWGGDSDPSDLSKDAYVDDWYCVDGSVASAITLGANQITCRVPVSDSLLQWTPSSGGNGWSLVDERPFSGADFISETTNNEKSLFGINDDGIEYNVRGVRVIGQVLKTGLTSVKSRLIIKDGATQGSGVDRLLGSSAVIYYDVFPTRPGGADWDAATVDALTIGVEKVP